MIWLSVAIAFVVSLALSALLSWCGPVDRPRDRGMHKMPTPTSGGLAIMAGAAVGLLYLAVQFHTASWLFAASLALAVLLGLVGALDDLFDLPAKVKLAIQTLAALAFATFAPPIATIPLIDGFTLHLPVWLAIPGAALWIVVVLNAVNFMDGSNGLVAGSIAIVLLTFAVILGTFQITAGSWTVVAIVGAALGFLPLNFPRARLFQGDAGALFLGGITASLWVAIAGHSGQRHANLLALPIALLPILTDVFLTLIARARRRAPLLDAHRDHLYQRWLAARGGDHAALAWRFWTIMVVFAAAAVIAAISPATVATLFLATATIVAVAGWAWIDRRVRAHAAA